MDIANMYETESKKLTVAETNGIIETIKNHLRRGDRKMLIDVSKQTTSLIPAGFDLILNETLRALLIPVKVTRQSETLLYAEVLTESFKRGTVAAIIARVTSGLDEEVTVDYLSGEELEKLVAGLRALEVNCFYDAERKKITVYSNQ